LNLLFYLILLVISAIAHAFQDVVHQNRLQILLGRVFGVGYWVLGQWVRNSLIRVVDCRHLLKGVEGRLVLK
jgi:hypothetical protein